MQLCRKKCRLQPNHCKPHIVLLGVEPSHTSKWITTMYVSDVLLKTWTEILWRSLYRIVERDGVEKGNGCDRSVTFTFQFEFLPFSMPPGSFSVYTASTRTYPVFLADRRTTSHLINIAHLSRSLISQPVIVDEGVGRLSWGIRCMGHGSKRRTSHGENQGER